MTEKIEATLNAVADRIKEIDEKIQRIERLVDYQGTLRVYTGDRGMDSAWEGNSSIVCSAVSEQASKDVADLNHEKASLLSLIVEQIVKEVVKIKGWKAYERNQDAEGEEEHTRQEAETEKIPEEVCQ